MKFVFWKAPKGYEDALAPALISGAAACGDEIVIKPTEDYHGPEFDGGILVGVVKRDILWEHRAANHPLVYLDKGYWRTRAPYGDRSLPEWWRMVAMATHPTDYLMDVQRPFDRVHQLGVEHAKKRNKGKNIVILGSSEKFHKTHHLAHPNEWTADLVREIRQYSDRPIIYRPKPSWALAQPIDGTTFDHGAKTPVSDALDDAFVAITYGSIASVDAILAGVPCIVLGNAVARPVSSTSISEIENPHWAGYADREQWFANLTYCHFKPQEIESGLGWRNIKEVLSRVL